MANFLSKVRIDGVDANIKDASLTAALNTEITTRTAEDARMDAAIAAETAARTAAIDAETTARTAADQALQNAIDAEEAAREAADADILDRIQGSLLGNLPDKMYYARPVLRPEIPSGRTGQGGAPFKVNNTLYYAYPVIDGTNITAEIWIYDVEANTRVAILAGNFYHASTITVEGSTLYVTGGGNHPVVTVIDASIPASPAVDRVIDFSASMQHVFDFGTYKNGLYYVTPSLYDETYIYTYDMQNGVLSRSDIKIPADIKGLRQCCIYEPDSDTFAMLTSAEANIAFFNETGIVKTVALNSELGLVPTSETEGLAFLDGDIWINDTPWDYPWDTAATPGCVWVFDGNNPDLNRSFYGLGDTFVTVDPTAADGLHNAGTDGRNYMYPLTFKYLYDIQALASLTNLSEIRITIEADFTGSTLPLLGAGRNYYIALQNHLIGCVYQRGCRSNFFTGVNVNVNAHANWLRSVGSTKTWIFAYSMSDVQINENLSASSVYDVVYVERGGTIRLRSTASNTVINAAFCTRLEVLQTV